jgi:hypothetical protein
VRKAAVKAKTSGETIPKARNESKTGKVNPSVLEVLRVVHPTMPAAIKPTVVATIRPPSATSSRVWQ